jgi:hypothetical protein
MVTVFLRFTVGERDPESQWWKGLFTAAYELRESGRLTPDEMVLVQEIIDWFNEHLPIPTCFRRLKERRAICWFTASAGEPLTKIWELVTFLESQGIFVRLHKTADPGTRLYRDEYQVVAVPQRQQRLRVAR